MIISWSRGRLGNQFFQYSLAMEAARTNEKVLLIGYEDLKRGFSRNLGLIFPVKESWQKRSRKAHRLFKRLADRGLIGSINTSLPHGTICSVEGRFGVKLVVDELAQVQFTNRGRWVHNLVSERLKRFEASRSGIDHESCFIHVRRTDYATWPRPDIPALLPSQWFQDAVQQIKESKKEQVHFFVVTDDPQWVAEDHFLSQFPLFEGDAIESWLAMASSNSGILSPSSFAYWAAIVAQERSEDGVFVAPLYWGAWRAHEWYPPGMEEAPFIFLEANRGDPSSV